MELIIVILLGLILATLIFIMLVFLGALDNIRKNTESIEGNLSEIRDALNKTADRMVDIVDSTANISNISIDMKYHQKMLREQEMKTVIEKMQGIESGLADLKIVLSSSHTKGQGQV